MDQETVEHEGWADALNLRLCFVWLVPAWTLPERMDVEPLCLHCPTTTVFLPQPCVSVVSLGNSLQFETLLVLPRHSLDLRKKCRAIAGRRASQSHLNQQSRNGLCHGYCHLP